MSDSGDEADSRTASVGINRPRSNNSSTRGSGDNDSRPTKRRRRNQNRAKDVNDIVPRGGSFSGTPLQVDPEDTSSSGSSSESEKAGSDSGKSVSSQDKAPVNPNVGSTAPAISWNQGKKNAVRTTLGKRKAATQPASKPQTTTANPAQFSTVNAYWKARDDSASPEPSGKDTGVDEGSQSDEDSDDSSDLEEGEIDSEGDSDSESLGSEADDSIMLNIGSKPEDGADEYNPEDLVVMNGQTNGYTNGISQNGVSALPLASGTVSSESKEEAFRQFTQKYPSPPASLVDLNQEDMDIQARHIYWDRDVNDIDLQLPIGCTECLQHGHLAAVCPTKECVHCNAWDEHPSTLCPSWRRCQRCRERGHNEKQCPSPLKSSADEVPCDLCGSSQHTENACDHQWKFPMRPATSQEFRVSISCAHCVSSSHLIGDCPSLRRSLNSTSFSLKGIPPSAIVNINTMPKESQPPINYKQGRARPQGARGGVNARSPSPSSDDMLPRKGSKPQPPRGRGRGGPIRFSTGPDKSRGRLPSRGRPPFAGNGTHKRFSPPPGPPLPRGPPPRGPSSRGGPPPRGRGRGAARGAPRGGGRGRRGK
ncbi:hypothetical protein N7456_013505 [Penicillium angulare]|uniref:CCHC-type domain-containing protein n=1 Tax=Penicillium angulare TaxID=116970 RepID=A0A9W9EG79_9EURO|nr:hypothetical protein N7456_013505 [Penicillium angulare]